MKRIHLTVLALAFSGAIAMSHADDMPVIDDAKASTAEIHTKGRIEAIDLASRGVTIKGEKGNVFQFHADDTVKNFDQLKVGDIVSADYELGVVLAIQKGGAGIRESVETTAQASAPAGAKPGGAELRRQTLVANVLKVDHKTGIATLKGPKGRVVDVKIQDPEVLKDIKKGDQVVAVITEQVAISVTPAQ